MLFLLFNRGYIFFKSTQTHSLYSSSLESLNTEFAIETSEDQKMKFVQTGNHPQKVDASKFLSAFLVNDVEVSLVTLDKSLDSIIIKWIPLDLLIPFEIVLLKNVTNFSFFARGHTNFDEKNQSSMPIEISQVHECYHISCLKYTFSNETFNGIKKIQDIINRTLEFEFTLSIGTGKASWKVKLEPILSDMIVTRVNKSPSLLIDLFESISINGKILTKKNLKEDSEYSEILDLEYVTPTVEFEFKFPKEDTTLIERYGRNEAGRVFFEAEGNEFNRKDILLLEKLEGKYKGFLSKGSFKNIKNCKDLHQRVLVVGLFYRGREGSRIQGKFRIRYRVPVYLMGKYCTFIQQTDLTDYLDPLKYMPSSF
ncbi:hypothetical protein HMI55_006075 [Coelomomyces lativittatus]|nr:hypothetical protein HMI56_005675 [Coelomomyces lativittatus]KAJ1512867.1 hypothetical protein HMI55_006075 [Coelomomyces lativittatus]